MIELITTFLFLFAVIDPIGSVPVYLEATKDFDHKNKIKIAVTDNGSGISKEDIAYIFDARYRASNAIEDSTTHAGLGLAISQKLSKILNSELFVESKLGQGSCFSLALQQVKH